MNGRIECAHRVCCDKARCGLNSQGLPVEFWPFTMRSAVNITNLVPTISDSDNKSPHQLLGELLGLSETARSPFILHLRGFKTRMKVYIRKEYRSGKKDKMAKCAWDGRLTGYDGNHGKIFITLVAELSKILRVTAVKLFGNDSTGLDDKFPQIEHAAEFVDMGVGHSELTDVGIEIPQQIPSAVLNALHNIPDFDQTASICHEAAKPREAQQVPSPDRSREGTTAAEEQRNYYDFS